MKIIQIASHRNGVNGEPFHAILFKTRIAGRTDTTFLATVFDAPGHVSVIAIDLLAEQGVTFGANSWRGDHYEADLRAAIARYRTDTPTMETRD